MADRIDWHPYFMNIAKEVSSRSTCPRKHVGAVIVRDRRILSTGYNGSLRGLAHCDDVGCLMEDGHCIATVHAEANAILQAAMNGVRIEGGRDLHDRFALLGLLQADRERGDPGDLLRRVLPGEEDPRVRGADRDRIGRSVDGPSHHVR